MATSDAHVKAMTPHVNRLWPTPGNLDGLFAAGESVAQMRATRGWACVMAIVDDEIRGVEGKLDGKLMEHVEYAHLHGQLRGLKSMAAAATAITDHAQKRLQEQADKHEAGAESPA